MNIDRMALSLRQSKLLRILLYPALAIRRYKSCCRDAIKNEVLDNLGQLLTDDSVVTLPQFRGSFTMGSQSQLFRDIVKTRDYEPQLAWVFTNHLPADRDVIDIGANIGLYTVLFAKMPGDRRVLSIEPTPNALVRLRKNILLNDVQEKVIIYGGVASDHSGDAEIKTVAGQEEYSTMGSLTHPHIAGAHHEIIQVSSATIDGLTAEHHLNPGFIKMDVEGMEHIVLKGMTEVLKHQRPVILSELSDPLLRKNGSSSLEVVKFIEDYGYLVTDPVNKNLRPGKRIYGDILCVPMN